MPALPGGEWGEAPSVESALAIVAHGFTHFTLNLTVIVRSEPVGEGWWQPIASLTAAGLPTLYRNAVEAVLANRSQSLAA